jgi:hypothetical protein
LSESLESKANRTEFSESFAILIEDAQNCFPQTRHNSIKYHDFIFFLIRQDSGGKIERKSYQEICITRDEALP